MDALLGFRDIRQPALELAQFTGRRVAAGAGFAQVCLQILGAAAPTASPPATDATPTALSDVPRQSPGRSQLHSPALRFADFRETSGKTQAESAARPPEVSWEVGAVSGLFVIPSGRSSSRRRVRPPRGAGNGSASGRAASTAVRSSTTSPRRASWSVPPCSSGSCARLIMRRPDRAQGHRAAARRSALPPRQQVRRLETTLLQD